VVGADAKKPLTGLCQLVTSPPETGDWLSEIKLDGYQLAKELRKVPAILPIPGGDAVQGSMRSPRRRGRRSGGEGDTGHAFITGS
jgi:hypothetical protein